MCFQVDRYTRRLDQELSKFKMELEADNAGITEMLEKRNNLMLELETKGKEAVAHLCMNSSSSSVQVR